jgi:CelD/BcsL family acetyltransferase involved in cellulose biosynthesis
LTVAASSSLSCVVVSEPTEAERLRPEWNALLARCARNEITQSPDWLLTWWRVFGGLQGRRLRLGLFRDAGRLIGLAPLLRRRHWYGGALPFRRLELLASGEPLAHGICSNHLAVLAERGAEERVARAFVRGLTAGAFGDWDEVVLPMMSGDTPMPRLLVDAFQAAGINAELTETTRAPYGELPPTWDAYLQALGRNSRRHIKRSLQAFDEWAGGATRLESVCDLADLEKGKAILVQLHQGRWAGDGQLGVFRSPLFLQFHDDLMRRLLVEGKLELLWLCVRDEPVAALYGMVWAGKVYAYQTGRRFDLPEDVRPGFVLLVLAVRRAIEAGRQEFDLLADDMVYKRQLVPTARSLVQVRAARASVREKLRRGARGILRRLREKKADNASP